METYQPLMLICHVVHIYVDTSVIQLPSKVKKRGRPKGGDLTVIGLPKKKKVSSKPVAFLKLHPKDQERGNDSFCTCLDIWQYIATVCYFIL